IPKAVGAKAHRTILERPVHYTCLDDPGNSCDRVEKRLWGVLCRRIIVKQHSISAMNVAVKPDPIQDPCECIILREREENTPIPKEFRRIGCNIDLDGSKVSLKLEHLCPRGGLHPDLGMPVHSPDRERTLSLRRQSG